ANMLRNRGDLAAAADLYAEALSLAPDWAEAHFALAEMLEATGRIEDACAHFRDYLRQADADTMGAEVRLALLGVTARPETLPEPYVRALFDEYAPRFEQSLLGGLGYRAPWQMRTAVEAVRPAPSTGERILDLGCGTGLGGEAFRDRAAWMVGVDLSPGMLREARAKNLYNELREANVESETAFPDMPFDLVVAADVLVYLGDLSLLFKHVTAALAPGGLFAFSVQAGTEPEPGFTLGVECRYAHHETYLHRTAAGAGMDMLTLYPAVCRREAGLDVPSLIGVARRPAKGVAAWEAPLTKGGIASRADRKLDA
ncbi:MAG: methyltransferase domain-containing protein, partial [Rhodospirillales bacterium]|nr:methyltransferase domain-containing protein [Rhodospirillales bacterium]